MEGGGSALFEIQIPAGTPVIGAVTFFQIKLGKFRLLRAWRIFLLVLGVLSLLVGPCASWSPWTSWPWPRW